MYNNYNNGRCLPVPTPKNYAYTTLYIYHIRLFVYGTVCTYTQFQ